MFTFERLSQHVEDMRANNDSYSLAPRLWKNKVCFGVRCDDILTEFFPDLLDDILQITSKENLPAVMKDYLHLMRTVKTHYLGMTSIILYWPSIEVE